MQSIKRSAIGAALFASTILSAQAGQAHVFGNACKMIPPNSQFNAMSAGTGITEAQFNKVLDDVNSVYEPIFKNDHQATFKIERKWTDGTVNAYAMQYGSTWQISMFGGLARHKEVTADAFAVVACHEIGHHLGGQPRYDRGTDWASVEGQSDYFATLKCMRKVLEATGGQWLAENEFQAMVEANPIADAKCKEGQNTTQQQYEICMRSAIGGEAAARLLASLGREPMPKFETPDASKVTRTNEAHPAAQCRLDTYFAGAVCPVDHNEVVDGVDARKGTCNPAAAPTFTVDLGIRPACWYKEVDPKSPAPPDEDDRWPW